MIFHPVLPRSPEWKALRCGIPTSSCFDKIVTPKKLEQSKQVELYLNTLLAEWVTGEPVESVSSKWMERGIELEDQAIAAYEFTTDRETQLGGFCTTDDGLIGCSPDRLIGEDGDLEIKCPALQTQIGYAFDPKLLEDEYRLQVQGRMMIHGRAWVDIFSYHQQFSITRRVHRDEAVIKVLRLVMEAFVGVMVARREELERRFGPFVRPVAVEPDHSRDFVSDADAEAILGARRST